MSSEYVMNKLWQKIHHIVKFVLFMVLIAVFAKLCHGGSIF